MIGLAILCFVGAAFALLFAFRPKESFYLDEGWKFKNKVEPSDAYVAFNGIGGVIVAIGLVGVGIGAIGTHMEDRHAADEAAALAASKDRCQKVVLPRFKQTVKWDGTVVANPDQVKALGPVLHVDVDIKREQGYSVLKNVSVPYDNVEVTDPQRPGNSKTLFTLMGQFRDVSGMEDFNAKYDVCY